LKRAAVLAFHPEPERFVTGAFVKIGYFRSNDDLLYHDEVHGDLFSQVSHTMDLLLTKYLKAAITYRGLQRIETFPVPEPALREALLNAIIHKDYATGTPIQISVYAEKLMIWNPGQLPPAWTVDKLKVKHASHPFNPDTANVFFRAGEIEAWGRGVERIYAACREARFPEPVIEQEAAGLWISFPFSPEIIQRTARADSPETGEKTGEKTREKLLRLVRESPQISTQELAQALGITPKGVEWQVRKLKEEGLLKRVGPDKGGHWEAKD
jgi:ATP-dependent DNA helicase RecG